MKALPGAAVTFEPWGCEHIEIFIYFFETSVCVFSGGKQRVKTPLPHAETFRDTRGFALSSSESDSTSALVLCCLHMC